jgi:hypothetical protein
MNKQTFKMVGNKVVSTTTIKSKEPVETLAAFNARQAIKQGYSNYQPSAICTSETEMAPLVKISINKPFFIASQGYYLCMNSDGRVLFLESDSDSDATADGLLPYILRKPQSGNAGSGKGVINTSFVEDQKNPNGRKLPENLSQSDFNSIISGKPSVDQLLSVYDCWSNSDVNIDVSKATPVW